MDETLNEKMMEELIDPTWHPAKQVNDEIMVRLGRADAPGLL